MKLPVEESDFIPCDILDIVRRIRPHSPAAAVRFVEAFKSSVDLLARMPDLGRVRADLGAPETRSWRVAGFRNYLIFYESLPDRIVSGCCACCTARATCRRNWANDAAACRGQSTKSLRSENGRGSIFDF